MDLTLVEAKSALAKAKDDMAQYYNWCRILALEYQVWDKVYLDVSNIHTTRPSQKLAHRYLSPFMIVWKVRWNVYCLCLPTSMSCLHPIFNVIKLLQTLSDPLPGQKANPPPPPEIVDGEEHYIVEWILDSWFMRSCLQFLMKWEGYGYEENSWVSEQDVRGKSGYLLSCLLRCSQRCSIGLRSGDLAGQSITWIPWSLNQVWASLEVCLGSLSCWKMAFSRGIPKSSILWGRCWSRISTYCFASILPSTSVSIPTPFQPMQPHTIMFPPPYL